MTRRMAEARLSDMVVARVAAADGSSDAARNIISEWEAAARRGGATTTTYQPKTQEALSAVMGGLGFVEAET